MTGKRRRPSAASAASAADAELATGDHTPAAKRTAFADSALMRNRDVLCMFEQFRAEEVAAGDLSHKEQDQVIEDINRRVFARIREVIGEEHRFARERVYADDAPRAVRVYADGIFDMFHAGHARSLMQAKHLFPNTYLIVGVCNDEMTHRLKGKTVMNERERAEALYHARWVDEVVEDAPWIVTQEFIDLHQIDYVVHGEDPCLDEHGNDIYAFVKNQGKYLTTKRTVGVSTSDIIVRLLRDYNSYVRRNLKRGFSGKDMNVSYIKEQSIKLDARIDDLKKEMREKVRDVREETIERFDDLKADLVDLSEKYKQFQKNLWRGFVGLFGNAAASGSLSASEEND
jgi:cytidyltransferase-like protein